jgi:hypothetical protein
VKLRREARTLKAKAVCSRNDTHVSGPMAPLGKSACAAPPIWTRITVRIQEAGSQNQLPGLLRSPKAGYRCGYPSDCVLILYNDYTVIMVLIRLSPSPPIFFPPMSVIVYKTA